jgi:antitoxin Phd
MKSIQLKDAKATLSAVVDDAVAGRPSLITRHVRKEAVVLSFAEYERLSKKIPSFGELLMAFPGDADDLPLRSAKPLRDLF